MAWWCGSLAAREHPTHWLICAQASTSRRATSRRWSSSSRPRRRTRSSKREHTVPARRLCERRRSQEWRPARVLYFVSFKKRLSLLLCSCELPALLGDETIPARFDVVITRLLFSPLLRGDERLDVALLRFLVVAQAPGEAGARRSSSVDGPRAAPPRIRSHRRPSRCRRLRAGRPRSQVQSGGTQRLSRRSRVTGITRRTAATRRRRSPGNTPASEMPHTATLNKHGRVPCNANPAAKAAFLTRFATAPALHLGSPQQIQPRRIQGMAERGQGQVGRLPVAPTRVVSLSTRYII